MTRCKVVMDTVITTQYQQDHQTQHALSLKVEHRFAITLSIQGKKPLNDQNIVLENALVETLSEYPERRVMIAHTVSISINDCNVPL